MSVGYSSTLSDSGRSTAESKASEVLDGRDARVASYDFYRQEVIERARLRLLDPVFETMAHRIGNSLAGAARQHVQVVVTDSEQIAWDEFAGGLPDPTYISTAVAIPFEGRLAIHIPVQTVFHLLDFYLGGDGVSQPQRGQLTDIERIFISSLLEDVWQALAEGFRTVIEVRVGMVQNFTSVTLVQFGRPGETCLVVTLALTVGDSPSADFQLCLPLIGLLPLLEQLEAEQRGSGFEDQSDRSEAYRRLLAVPVELRLSYPPIALTTTELLSLRAGDVIAVREGTPEENAELSLVTGEFTVGTGVLVERGNKLACSVMTKTEEF